MLSAFRSFKGEPKPKKKTKSTNHKQQADTAASRIATVKIAYIFPTETAVIILNPHRRRLRETSAKQIFAQHFESADEGGMN
jgi:hypothetical protein